MSPGVGDDVEIGRGGSDAARRGGLTTAQIARAFLVPETTTMAQRISRAKTRLREVDARFTLPAPEELPDRLALLQDVLYLIFNEGYTSCFAPDMFRCRGVTSEPIFRDQGRPGDPFP